MKASSPRSLALNGTPVALPKMTLWKHVAAGGLAAPFCALLVFLSRGGSMNPVTLLIGYTVAGALTSLLCGAVLKYSERQDRRTRTHTPQLVLLACLGAAAILVAAALLEVSLRSAHAPAGMLADAPLFLGLLGFWNCFSLMYGEWQRTNVLALRTQSRLRGLQAQIQPHFFFNTLNTVSALIPEQPAEAQAVIQRLAAIFRKSLAATPDSTTVPLDQELDLTREYLEIEKARFGARVRYSLPDPGEASGWQIPALTLQPLVENAVRHGIACLASGGEVRVTLVSDETGFELQVTNPVEEPRDIDLDRLLREGHSLQLIADRLQLMYNGRARITAEVDDQFHIRIRIPGRRR
jgi:two-component system sensor histidine kinase AlgZ